MHPLNKARKKCMRAYLWTKQSQRLLTCGLSRFGRGNNLSSAMASLDPTCLSRSSATSYFIGKAISLRCRADVSRDLQFKLVVSTRITTGCIMYILNYNEIYDGLEGKFGCDIVFLLKKTPTYGMSGLHCSCPGFHHDGRFLASCFSIHSPSYLPSFSPANALCILLRREGRTPRPAFSPFGMPNRAELTLPCWL